MYSPFFLTLGRKGGIIKEIEAKKRRGRALDSLLYSLNATVPVFLVMVLGYLFRRTGLLNEEFVRVANRFCYQAALPVLLFCNMYEADLRQDFNPRLLLFCVSVTTIMFFSIWFLTRLLMRDKSMVGAFVQACYRSSVAVLGVAFVANIYGDAGLAPQMILGSVPLFNAYAVIVLTFEGENRGSGRANLLRAAKGVVTNPILLGVVLGMLASLAQITFPVVMEKTLSMVGTVTTPLALLCIGAGFEGKKALAKLRPTAVAAVVKLLVLPGIFLPAAVALGFRGQALMTILLMLGTPTNFGCYVMAKNMKGDDVLTSSVIVSTTLLSAFTLTFWIFLYRQLGLL